jgi:hypothetical protein
LRSSLSSAFKASSAPHWNLCFFSVWLAVNPGDSLMSRVVIAQFVTVVFESAYQVYLCLDAVWLQNLVQVVGVCLNSLCILIVIVLVYETIGTDSQGHILLAIVLACPAIGMLLVAGIAWRLRNDFEWLVRISLRCQSLAA